MRAYRRPVTVAMRSRIFTVVNLGETVANATMTCHSRRPLYASNIRCLLAVNRDRLYFSGAGKKFTFWQRNFFPGSSVCQQSIR